MTDRATRVARAITQMTASTPREREEMIAAYLRDEFTDIKREAISEIRPEDG